MKLHDLRPNPRATRKRKRVGRGPGSGHGKTAGKGHKGMLARSGRANVAGFEGGQMPLARRLPKRGFHNPLRQAFTIVNLKQLALVPDVQEITADVLVQRNIVKSSTLPLKILGHGDLNRPLVVEAHSFSQSAIQKIQQAGGQAKVIGRA